MGNNMNRIAFSGKIAAGKTTAANALVRELGFQKMSLADELKSVGQDIGSWIHDMRMFNPGSLLALVDKTHPYGRSWLQWLGQRMRQVYPDVWIQALLRRLPNNRDVVVDDCRFLNEALALTAHGFVLARIEIPPEIQAFRVKTCYPQYEDLSILQDASETELDNWLDWEKVFDGSLPKEDFERGVVKWAQTR